MPKVKVNDIQIYYEVHGEGFPLIMIMGLSGNTDWWDPHLIEELSKEFKLVVFDNRGAGRTDISDRKYTVKLFADDTASLMDALGISRAHVLGISMGGMIAQELVLNYPEKVVKLVLCSTTCGGPKSVPPPQEALEMLAADKRALSKEEVARMIVPFLFTSDFIENNPKLVEFRIQRMLRMPISNEAYMRQLNAIMGFNTYERLSQIEVPALILHGKRDVLIPPENGSILARAIPNTKLVYFENSAHELAEEMEKAISVLLDFLVKS
jgi:pimeloyl-ACP methyl ester carboxylesterase